MGLMPLLLAFPIVIAVLGALGGNRANALLMSNARSHLAGSENYLEQLRTNTGVRLKQLVQSEQLAQLLAPTASRQELNQVLGTAARGGGLDFLIVARADGTIIASSTGATPGERLPHSHVITQAVVGITSTAYELFTTEELGTLSPDFPQQARVRPLGAPEGSPAIESRGLMITGAAHFPLTVNRTDAILVGGTLLNNNAPPHRAHAADHLPHGQPARGFGRTRLDLHWRCAHRHQPPAPARRTKPGHARRERRHRRRAAPGRYAGGHPHAPGKHVCHRLKRAVQRRR